LIGERGASWPRFPLLRWLGRSRGSSEPQESVLGVGPGSRWSRGAPAPALQAAQKQQGPWLRQGVQRGEASPAPRGEPAVVHRATRIATGTTTTTAPPARASTSTMQCLTHHHHNMRHSAPRARLAAGPRLQRSPARPSHQLARSAKLIEQLADGIEDPILRLAVKDPVAFTGGMFAGALKLSLNEDPLRSWIERTSALAGVSGVPVRRRWPPWLLLLQLLQEQQQQQQQQQQQAGCRIRRVLLTPGSPPRRRARRAPAAPLPTTAAAAAAAAATAMPPRPRRSRSERTAGIRQPAASAAAELEQRCRYSALYHKSWGHSRRMVSSSRAGLIGCRWPARAPVPRGLGLGAGSSVYLGGGSVRILERAQVGAGRVSVLPTEAGLSASSASSRRLMSVISLASPRCSHRWQH
jgi:hypothetical protein